MPKAIRVFLESVDFEDTIRKAISIGGDSDTIACMDGGIAEAYYKKITKNIEVEVYSRLGKDFIKVIDDFYDNFVFKG